MWHKKRWFIVIWAVWAAMWFGVVYFQISVAHIQTNDYQAVYHTANSLGYVVDDDGADASVTRRYQIQSPVSHATVVSSAPSAAIVPTPLPQPILTPTPLRILSKLPPEPTVMGVPPTLSPEALHRIARVPILMYHYISVPPSFQDQLRVNLSVPPDQFENQLKYLKENGYKTIDLYTLHDHLVNNTPLPAKPIILTFDDGYRDHYENAFPLLKKYGMVGTFFVFTDPVFQNHVAYMTWDMAREMAAAGMDIESHTKTHPDLRNRSNDFLHTQIYTPIDAITEQIGKRPRFFAYPAGQYDNNVMRVLADAQTWGAVTTRWGSTHAIDNSLTWTRMRVNYGMSVGAFAQMLN